MRIEKWKINLLVAVLLLIVLVTGGYYINDMYTVTDVSVTGNKHYTKEQIEDLVMTGKMGHSSLYLFMKYRNKAINNVPFVETMDVDIVSPTSISITVYEKAIAGYVEYLDRFMYFDKDGIVVESSTVRQTDVPFVTGLSFDHVILYEQLPVGDDEIFKSILTLTQLLSKYSIYTDQIHFSHDGNATLYFGDAKVSIGDFDNIDEKMLRLQGIIPELKGLSGTLYMDNYTENTDNDYITFQRDDVEHHMYVEDENPEDDLDSVSLDDITLENDENLEEQSENTQ